MQERFGLNPHGAFDLVIISRSKSSNLCRFAHLSEMQNQENIQFSKSLKPCGFLVLPKKLPMHEAFWQLLMFTSCNIKRYGNAHETETIRPWALPLMQNMGKRNYFFFLCLFLRSLFLRL
jgi:hypothetical protein